MIKTCEVCGKRTSKYICQGCGRAICELCIEASTWLCPDCYGKSRVQEPTPLEELEEEAAPIPPAIKLFLIGFMLIFIGVIVLMLATLFSGLTGSFGLILLLGPIPIIFGAGENLTYLLIIAAILTILCITIFIFLFLNRRMTKL
ncbi:MAG: DUF131 domain-containing protein [Candidatus Bathyarchaeia archaeon]